MLKKGWDDESRDGQGTEELPNLLRSALGWWGTSRCGVFCQGKRFLYRWVFEGRFFSKRKLSFRQKNKGPCFQERWGSWMMNWFENLLLLWVLPPENQAIVWRQWKFFCWIESSESWLNLSWVSSRERGFTRERNKQIHLSTIRCLKLKYPKFELISLDFLSSPWGGTGTFKELFILS